MQQESLLPSSPSAGMNRPPMVDEQQSDTTKDAIASAVQTINDITALAAQDKDDPVYLNGLPPRAYLDATVTPVLLEALKHLAQERPQNPLEYLGMYLIKNANALKNANAQANS